MAKKYATTLKNSEGTEMELLERMLVRCVDVPDREHLLEGPDFVYARDYLDRTLLRQDSKTSIAISLHVIARLLLEERKEKIKALASTEKGDIR